MRHVHLGNSGLKISEIIYGNWLTHASQVENEQARRCVSAALDAGITTFDTADTYANTQAEVVLGEALAGQRRESLEILTKVYWPIGKMGPNDSGLSRKHIMEAIDGSLWTYRDDSFLPHGTARDGPPARQPIFLTSGEDNPNGAQVRFLVEGATLGELAGYDRVVHLFDGHDQAAVELARAEWKRARAAGCEVTYWQQADNGRWEKRA